MEEIEQGGGREREGWGTGGRTKEDGRDGRKRIRRERERDGVRGWREYEVEEIERKVGVE